MGRRFFPYSGRGSLVCGSDRWWERTPQIHLPTGCERLPVHGRVPVTHGFEGVIDAVQNGEQSCIERAQQPGPNSVRGDEWADRLARLLLQHVDLADAQQIVGHGDAVHGVGRGVHGLDALGGGERTVELLGPHLQIYGEQQIVGNFRILGAEGGLAPLDGLVEVILGVGELTACRGG